MLDDHVVVNVVGLMACADLRASTSLPLAEFHYFTHLVIDLDRTHDAPLFRLAESPITILLRSDLAEAVGHAQFVGAHVEPVEG